MIFEAAAHERHPVGQARRGKGIALVTHHPLTVEREADGLQAIDVTASGQPDGVCLHTLGTARAEYETPASLVAVLRSSTSHWRQPSTCWQYSRCGPFGLSNRKT